jgi:hypothetical protein
MYNKDNVRNYVPSLCKIPESEILTMFEIELGECKKINKKKLKEELRENKLIDTVDDKNLFIDLKNGVFIVEFKDKHLYNPSNDNMEMLGYMNLKYLVLTF